MPVKNFSNNLRESAHLAHFVAYVMFWFVIGFLFLVGSMFMKAAENFEQPVTKRPVKEMKAPNTPVKAGSIALHHRQTSK